MQVNLFEMVRFLSQHYRCTRLFPWGELMMLSELPSVFSAVPMIYVQSSRGLTDISRTGSDGTR